MQYALRFLAVLALAGVATSASAQVQTGSILVKATDEQGAATPAPR